MKNNSGNAFKSLYKTLKQKPESKRPQPEFHNLKKSSYFDSAAGRERCALFNEVDGFPPIE
jgi:hypothetical protein